MPPISDPRFDSMRNLSGKTALFLAVGVIAAMVAFQAFGKHLELDDWVCKIIGAAFLYVIVYFWKRGGKDSDENDTWKPLILHVEDNDVQRRVFAWGLRERMKLNFDLQSCDSGEKAWDSLTKSDFLVIRPDIIVLDLTLPGVSGQDFLKKLRNDPDLFHIKVIILSSTPRSEVDQPEVVDLCDFYLERRDLEMLKEAILACDPRMTRSPFEELSKQVEDYKKLNHQLKQGCQTLLDALPLSSLIDRQKASLPVRELLNKSGEISGRWNARLGHDAPKPPTLPPDKKQPPSPPMEPPQIQ
jgi:CheY-like chemotaxis protein